MVAQPPAFSSQLTTPLSSRPLPIVTAVTAVMAVTAVTAIAVPPSRGDNDDNDRA